MDKVINPVDALLDPNNSDNIVLYNDQDEPIEFEQIAVIPGGERTFVILQPVEKFEGLGEDEAFAFEIVEDEDGNTSLQLVEDDDLIDWIFNEYKDLYKKGH